MDQGKVIKKETVVPNRETKIVSNPMSPSRIREIERKITAVPEKKEEKEKVKVGA